MSGRSHKTLWQLEIRDLPYSPRAKLFGWTISSHANADGSECRPGFDRLIRETRQSKSTLRLARNELGEGGSLAWVPGNGRRATVYELLLLGGVTDDTGTAHDTPGVPPVEPGGVTHDTPGVSPTAPDYYRDHEQDHGNDDGLVAAPPKRHIDEVDHNVVALLKEARELVGGGDNFVSGCLRLYCSYPKLTAEHAAAVLAQFDEIGRRKEGDGRGTYADYTNLPGAFYIRLRAKAWAA